MARLTPPKTLGIVVLLWAAITQAETSEPTARAEAAARRAEAAATRSEEAARRVEAAAQRLERLVEKLEQSRHGTRGSANAE